MAQSTKNEQQAQQGGAAESRQQNIERSSGRRAEGHPARGQSGGLQWFSSAGGPFELMRRVTQDMDRLFERALGDFGRSWGGERDLGSFSAMWTPRIEAFRKEDKFVVRAELPGLKKDDVHVEVGDDVLTIRGERRQEHEDEREGVYMSERSYGSFHRTIPLPEGAIAENADASFRDGVLEVTMPCPPNEVSRGRRLEIKDASEQSGRK